MGGLSGFFCFLGFLCVLMCVFVFFCCYFVAVTVAVADFILHPLGKELSVCIGYPEQQEKSLHHVSQDDFSFSSSFSLRFITAPHLL